MDRTSYQNQQIFGHMLNKNSKFIFDFTKTLLYHISVKNDEAFALSDIACILSPGTSTAKR